MTRNVTTLSATVAFGLSAIVLSACGRAPTEPALAAHSAQLTVAPPTSMLAADQPTGSARVTTVADTTDVTTTASGEDDALATREQELARREAELRAQQEALRREREQLDAQRASSRGGASSSEAGSGSYDADQSTVAAATPVSSVQRVPTPPVVVPAGTTMQVELTANVNTKTARVGDRVEGRLASDLMIDDRRAATAGAPITGKVTELVSGSDKVGGVPTLGLTFDSLQAANGATIPILARYRKQGDSDTGEDAAKVVGGAAAGAVIGHEVGDDDKDTVVGGILGGAAGAAAAKKTGGEVKVRAGRVITVSTETSFSIY